MRKLRNHSRNLKESNIERIRKLRKEMSVSEKVMWQLLRRDDLGYRFRRQYPIGPYALDFYCPAAKLCVEVDGEQHSERVLRDENRDAYLAELGIRTLRVPSLDIFSPGSDELIEWLRIIRSVCEERTR